MTEHSDLSNSRVVSAEAGDGINKDPLEKEDHTDGDLSSADPLFQALLSIVKLEHMTCSENALLAGLPLEDGRLTPDLFVRAAYRAGFSSSVVKRSLQEVSQVVLPAVLLLKNNDAVVLLENDGKAKSLKVLIPYTDEVKHVPYTELDEYYTGFSIFLSSVENYDDSRLDQAHTYHRHWFWGTLAKSWRIYRDVLIASVMINLFALANPLFVMNIYDRVVPNDAIETLWALTVGIACIYIFDFIIKTLRIYFIEVAGKKSDVMLSSFILERVLGARYDQHPKSVGAFVSYLRDFETIRNFITSTTVTAFVDLPFVILFIAVISYVGGSIVWVPLSIIPIIVCFAIVAQKILHRSVSHTFLASAQKSATLVEAVTLLETVKCLGAESKVQRTWERAVGRLAYWGLKARVVSSSASSFTGFMQQMASVGVIVVGVYLISDHELTMGALIACVLLSGRVLAPFAQVVGLLVQYHQSKMALESLGEIVAKPQERTDDRVFIKKPKLEGKIEFKNVDFSYPDEEIKTLTNISFSIRAGERVAIIGRLGSGKTTVQKLIMGLYQPTSGSILIDGIDIKQIDPSDVRSNIGYVPQDCALFNGTVRDNITYGKIGVDDKEVLRVSELAGVTEFINAHPMGFDRIIGERGEGLSGGQKQSIILARGLLNEPTVFLLDEPTTGLDHASEGRVLANMANELKNKTLVLVTHKTPLLEMVSRIIILDGGKIIADGAKENVLDALKKGQLRVS